MAQSETILFVEDDAVTLTAYRNRLDQEGFKVESARDGVEALKCLYKSQPDLLLLDLMLPRLNGEDVLKILYSDSRLNRIPVIVLSANYALNMANQHLVERAAKHLLKETCDVEKLLKAVKEVLTSSKDARETCGETGDNSKNAQPPITHEIEDLQNQMQVVCAWTGRIKVDDQWMTISDFLSKRLHLKVTHGMSPEAAKEFLKESKLEAGLTENIVTALPVEPKA